MTHRKHWFALFVLLCGFALAGDVFLGWISGANEIRVAARQFREEAAYLDMSTKNLVPNIEHSYPDWDTSENVDPKSRKPLRRFRTDANGFVVDTPDASRHKVTILFLGGSTTECNEVAAQSRFPTVVQRRLRELGFDVATINAGVRGHTTQDDINTLLNRPGLREADIVVLMENINDRLRLGIHGDYFARLGKASPTSAAAVVDGITGTLEAMWDFMVYRSNTLFLLSYLGDENAAWREKAHGVQVTERSIDLYDDAVLRNREKYEQNIRLFVNIVRTLGKRPVLMTQPLGRQSNGQNVFNEIVRDVARRDDIVLLDLDKAIDPTRKEAFLFDNIHLNSKGSEFVGEFIASTMVPFVVN